MKKSSGIGGQAVMEGVMMRAGSQYAVAVRKPDHTIEIKTEEVPGLPKSEWAKKIRSLPFIRGIFGFVSSLTLGMKALNYSSEIAISGEEEEEPSRFEKWLSDKFGEKGEEVLSTLITIVAFIFAMGIFVVLPAVAGHFLAKIVENRVVVSLLEGLLRVLIFITYVTLIGKMEEIHRLYQYHGAEHKCINCVEAGLPLTVENVKTCNREHKRCGTSFMLYVMLIAILLFVVIDAKTIAMRILSRILLIPVVAGISYEFIQLAGNSDNPVIGLCAKPGLLLQKLTVFEPDEEMIEVGIASVEAVFDWQEWQKKRRENEP